MGTVRCSTSATTTVGGRRREGSTLRAAPPPQPAANPAASVAATETESLRTCRVFITDSYCGPASRTPAARSRAGSSGLLVDRGRVHTARFYRRRPRRLYCQFCQYCRTPDAVTVLESPRQTGGVAGARREDDPCAFRVDA